MLNLKVKHTGFRVLYQSPDPFITGPGHYRRKQTIANGERYVTEELRSLEKITSAKSKDLPKKRYAQELLRELSENAHRFLDTARKVAALDVIYAFAVSIERT